MSDSESESSRNSSPFSDEPADLSDRDASIAPYVVRPLFFLLTMVLVLSAIAQLGGRILFANLENFEPRINELLEPRGIEVADVSGQWRFFNPILKIGSGSAPGANFGASWAEIDTLESLARNRIVLRNAQVSDLQVTLSQDEAGAWSLDGFVPTETTFDWQSLVWHSDQLELHANVMLRGFELPASELVLEASMTNFGGRHRGDIRLGNAGGGEKCGQKISQQADAVVSESQSCDLRARYSVEESALWFRPRSGVAILGANNLTLNDSAAELVGLAGLNLGTLDARMRLLDERFSGPIQLLDSSLQLPGGKVTNLSLLAEGWSEDDGSVANLALTALQLGDGDNVLELRGSQINWALDSGAILRVPEVSVDKVTALVNHLVAPDVPVALWIKRLDMTGQFTRFLASWSSTAGLGISGDFNSVAMQNFRGVPRVDDLAGSFTGGPGYLQLRMRDTSAVVGFPQLYREERAYDSVSGEVLMYFGQDYFGLKGDNLRFVAPEMTTTGSFSLVSAKPKSNNHLTLALSSDAGDFGDISPYVPYTLPQNALDWLAESGLSAKLEAPRFVMHAPLREEESQMGRSYLVDADMHTGAMVFNSAWPQIVDAEGHVKLSHTGILATLSKATFAGLALEDMNIRIPTGTTNVSATGHAVFDASTGLEFIRTTPLKSSMDFVADDWWASGQMRLAVDLKLPLDETATGQLDPRVQVNVKGQLEGTTFGLPEAGLTFSDLRGPLTYSYPYELGANDIEGRLFDRDMTLDLSTAVVGAAPAGKSARFAPRRIDFSMLGAIHSDDMWPLLNMEPSEVVDGLFDFSAVYSTETRTDSRPTLVAKTDFVGAKVTLPAPLGKEATQTAKSEFNITFGESMTRANLLYRGLLNADLGVGDGEIVGGHLHLFGEQELKSRASGGSGILADWDGKLGPVLIDGGIDFADVAEWSAGSEQGVELPPYRIDKLKIAHAAVGDFEVPAVEVSGESDDSLLRLTFDSEAAIGELIVPEVGTSELVLERFAYKGQDGSNLPEISADMGEDEIRASLFAEKGEAAGVTPVVDPLSPEILAGLTDMNVRIASLSIDGEDYGDWAFNVRTRPEGVAFTSLTADFRGIQVKSPEGAIWDRASNRTSIRTTLTAEDMGDVLEASGYARSLESESMLTRAAVSWPGSPLNFEMLQLTGDIQTGVKTGRFLDATSGNNALRIFSLLNFNAIAKRMSLNFKDVFGRGISFEKIEADTRLDNGVLRFVQPMKVEGTGGDFKINGLVDLNEGRLDNEMVVTLPVNKSLPWLGAYLALANPVVGISVLVGERILRKPIKELSSAKYKITGPADDPKLELVSVFDRSMDEGEGGGEGTEIEVPDDLPPLEELIEESPLATDSLLQGPESTSQTEAATEASSASDSRLNTKTDTKFDSSVVPPAAELPAVDSFLPGVREREIFRPEIT